MFPSPSGKNAALVTELADPQLFYGRGGAFPLEGAGASASVGGAPYTYISAGLTTSQTLMLSKEHFFLDGVILGASGANVTFRVCIDGMPERSITVTSGTYQCLGGRVEPNGDASSYLAKTDGGVPVRSLRIYAAAVSGTPTASVTALGYAQRPLPGVPPALYPPASLSGTSATYSPGGGFFVYTPSSGSLSYNLSAGASTFSVGKVVGRVDGAGTIKYLTVNNAYNNSTSAIVFGVYVDGVRVGPLSSAAGGSGITNYAILVGEWVKPYSATENLTYLIPSPSGVIFRESFYLVVESNGASNNTIGVQYIVD